jgi:hypothetical protein
MQTTSKPTANDPVSQAVLRTVQLASRFPVPLIATTYDVNINGGLADVTARRTFLNSEASAIEATLTFPIPVHAVLYSLEAKIGERTAKAIAKAKAAARQTYEDAIDRGKTAVLHEELMKGVHMLSVANVAPGTEIEVTARFALALAWIGGRALLRIPTTVGDIFGASGLPDSDELIHGGPVLAADLKVTCDSGTPVLLAGTLTVGRARISLDAPINVEVMNWTARDIEGRMADGKAVTLAIRPAAVSEANLDAAVLVDHSGSMSELCATTGRVTKHAAVLLGLSEAGDDLRDGDRLNLWQFDDGADDLGTFNAHDWRSGLRLLSGPQGGTQIGASLDALLAQRPARDVLLITDGKSYALDVQQLAASGARFTVVLIGDDSLDANVGHLAAMTGGEIFIPDGADVTGAVRSALKSLRSPRTAHDTPTSPTAVHATRSGMRILATYEPAAPSVGSGYVSRAVAAYVASLKMAQLPEAEAASLAEAEGLVTHLTSLILVDEEGAAQSGLPAMRKVALPSPATFQPRAKAQLMCYAPAMYADTNESRSLPSLKRRPASSANPPRRIAKCPPPPADGWDNAAVPELSVLIGLIDWKSQGARLAEGNLVGLAPEIADLIDDAARDRDIVRTAKRFGLSARTFVIGLIARADSAHDRYADRVARAVLSKLKPGDAARAAGHLGLGLGSRKTA